ncbi:MAG: hypothetical protein U1F22_10800 [Lysobacterales bacterium]
MTHLRVGCGHSFRRRHLRSRDGRLRFDANQVYASDAQLVICILGPDYPKRVWTKFESEQFKQRFKSGEVIPIVLSNAPLGIFDTAMKVGHIAWDRSGDFDAQVQTVTEVLIRKILDIRSQKQ